MTTKKMMTKTNTTKQVPCCSCLDSAFERQAIDQGLVTEPVFPENKLYLQEKK